MKVAILLLCGLPGAGKTTAAKSLKARCPSSYNFIHVCYDNLMERVDHHNDAHAWKNTRSQIVAHMNSLIAHLKNGDIGEEPILPLECGENICYSELKTVYEEIKNVQSNEFVTFLIDDNMQYRGMRYEYFKICRNHTIGFGIVYFDIPVNVCIQRNLQRPQPISQDVIRKLDIQMEIPGQQKNNWELNICILNQNDLNNTEDMVTKVYHIVQTVENSPVILQTYDCSAAEASRHETRKSLIHQSDICMRKFISQEITRLKDGSTDIKVLSQKLNMAKKVVLSHLKMGYIDETNFLNEANEIDFSALELKIVSLMSSEVA